MAPAVRREGSPISVRVLLALLFLVGVIAVAGGAAGVVFGPTTGEDARVAPSTAGEYRFLSGVWLALGVMLWWSLARPVRRVAVTRTVLIAGIAGGLARLVSFLTDGTSTPFVVALVVELLLLPGLLVWHARTIASTSCPGSAGGRDC